jgi:hypothetical protein
MCYGFFQSEICFEALPLGKLHNIQHNSIAETCSVRKKCRKYLTGPPPELDPEGNAKVGDCWVGDALVGRLSWLVRNTAALGTRGDCHADCSR